MAISGYHKQYLEKQGYMTAQFKRLKKRIKLRLIKGEKNRR